jgi:hypothetical protein
MHRRHDHPSRAYDSGNRPSGVTAAGHNSERPDRGVVQWQRPHEAGDAYDQQPDDAEPDLDLVETAFAEGFSQASDPTSFLRLAQVPFRALAQDKARLALLRVEVDAVTDVGAVMPHLGGETFRFDPLPASMVSRRRRLRFVYFDGKGLRLLELAEVRALAPINV